MQIARNHLKNGEAQLAIFSFDIIGTTISLEGKYEKEELLILEEWLMYKFEGCLIDKSVIDCGANIGNHTVFFSKVFQNVFSFEPNPRTFRLLEFNCYDLNNVECFNVGLSDENESFSLIVPKSNIGAAYLSKSHHDADSNNAIKVELKTLDSFDFHFDNLCMIKIDVEGHELSVLRGASGVIKRYLPLIAFEHTAKDIKNGTSEVIKWLKDHKYTRFYSIEKTPSIRSGIGGKLITLTQRFLFGQHMVIKLVSSFENKYYSLIIAEAE